VVFLCFDAVFVGSPIIIIIINMHPGASHPDWVQAEASLRLLL